MFNIIFDQKEKIMECRSVYKSLIPKRYREACIKDIVKSKNKEHKNNSTDNNKEHKSNNIDNNII